MKTINKNQMGILTLKKSITEIHSNRRLMSIFEIVEVFSELQSKEIIQSEELRRKIIKNNEQNLNCSYGTIGNILIYVQWCPRS